jgi:Protein of unknown function DUF262/Protein of unknown function (DUF1524)
MPPPKTISIVLSGLGEAISKGPWAVPAYQRSYAWEKEHVARLFSDLDEAIANEEDEYFLGSIVVKNADGGPPEIVDGQQRLATATILLAAIRDYFDRNKDTTRVESLEKDYLFATDFRTQERTPKLRLNGSDNEFFGKVILERPAEPGRKVSPGKNKVAQQNIKVAQQLAAEHVKRLAGPSATGTRLFDLVDYIRDCARVIWVAVPDDANAYMIFETLNDRGLELAISDLLKNYLFKHAGSSLDQVKQHWISMTAILEAVADEVVVDFIRHYWSSAYGLTRDKQLYDEFKKQVTNKKSAIEFASTIEFEAGRYAAMLSYSNSFWNSQSAKARDYMDILNRRLGMIRLRPLALAILSTLKSKKEVERSLRLLVNWSVRFLVTGGGAGTIEQTYAETARKIREKAIKNSTELYSAMKSIVPTDDQFEAAFKIATVSKSKIARYYLQTLERQKQGNVQPEWVPNENEDDVNLEHVMPQSPEGDWATLDPDILRTYTKRIGNLALMQSSANSTSGNEAFAEKKKRYAKSTLKLTSMVASDSTWNTGEIQARQEKLAAFAVKAWPRKI